MSQRDLVAVIPAGGSIPVQINEADFIFIKSAARPFYVIADQSKIKMRAGDKRRFAKSPDSIVLHNDSDNPLRIEYVVGTGDYDRIIVEGNLLAVSGVIKADGTRVEDRRYLREGFLNFVDTTRLEYAAGDFTRNSSAAFTTGNLIPGQYILDGVVYKMMGGSAPREVTYTLDGWKYLGDVAKASGLITAGSWKDYPQFIYHDTYNNKLWMRARDSGLTYRLWERDLPDGAWSTVAGGESVNHYSVHPDNGYVARFEGTTLKIYNPDGELMQSFAGVSSGPAGSADFYKDTAGDVWYMFNYGGSGGTRILKWSELITGNYNDYRGTHPLDLNADFSSLTDISVIPETRETMQFSLSTEKAAAMDDLVIAGRAIVSSGEARLVREDSTRVYAEVEHFTESGGRYCQGELIKSFLWVLLGEEPVGDYLDGVFYLEYQDKKGFKRVVEGGAQSFSALGIDDNFEFKNATRVVVKIDL